MRFLTGLTLCFLSVCMASCQKETSTEQNSNTSNSTNTDRVKTYGEKLSRPGEPVVEGLYVVGYDAQNRIISLMDTKDPGFGFTYSYASPKKIIMDILVGNMVSIHEEFYLNANNFIDSTFQYNDTQDSLTEKYLYNAKGQIEKIKQYNFSVKNGALLTEISNLSYDARNNLISESNSFYTRTNEYYNNLQAFTPAIAPIMFPFFDKKVDLIKKMTVSSGTETASANYTYTFDSKNRIIMQKAVISDGSVVEKTYTYFD